jgi:prepilin-type N-terminal cleavage/methylation domain-containing protein
MVIKRIQRGFTLLEMTAAIFISTLLIIMSAPAIVWKIEEASMEGTGIYMGVIKSALEKYNVANHDALAPSTPLAVAGFVNPLKPTIAELKTAKYIASPSFPLITPQRLAVNIDTNRMNCPGPNCQIIGYAYTTTALNYIGTTEPRYDLVSAFLASPGVAGSGMAAHNGDTAFLRSATHRLPNPVAGNPGGLIAIATYLDEGIYSNFVKIGDSRDPNLSGKLTVAGVVTGKSNIETSDGVAACLRAALTTGGQVLANSTNCIRRAFLDGTNGQAGVADAAGTVRVLLDGSTGKVASFDASGRNAAGITYNGTNQSVVYSDNLLNNAGTAGIRADGSVFGTRGEFGAINISDTAVAGAACAKPNDVVKTFIGSQPALMICEGGVWQSASGLSIATVGGACSVSGATGISTTGVGQICVNGQWMSNTNRFGRFAATDNYDNVVHGTVITKPFCGAGGLPKVYMQVQGAVASEFITGPTTSQYASNFRMDETINPGFYTAIVDDSVGYGVGMGTPMPGYALVVTGCLYN